MKIKCSRKTIIVLLSIVGMGIVLYALTFFFGIREVKLGYEAEFRRIYDETEALYKTNKLHIKGSFCGKRLDMKEAFPTWEEAKKFDVKISSSEYYVILPFFITAKCNDRYGDYEEYHLWYVFGERLLKRNQR